MRAKILPQDTNYMPRDGIKMLKDDLESEELGAADFRMAGFLSVPL